MSQQPDLFSPEWYRIATMRPLLRRQVQVSRQQFRGETWMVLREPGSNRLFRLTLPAWEIVSRFDGEHDLDSLWKTMCEVLGDDVPSQGEVLRLVTQLAGSDLLVADLPPDLAELGERSRDVAIKRVVGYFKSPLSLRFPLLDPDRFITATLPLGSWLFSRRGFMLWLAIIALALFQVVMHWEPLTLNMLDQILATENLVLLGLLYPLLKLIHELGHGWAVKRWGGEVRELGVMFLIFIPTPYVDASHAAFFKDKRQRMLVGFAGMQVELLLAAFATFLWVSVEPGLVRAVAYNVMIIAGVSAVMFNGNPLLRFDAYHILADWLEMPGFGNRANQYIGYLLQSRLLKMPVPNPAASVREGRWLGFYAIASFIYRLIIAFGIAFAVAGRFFIFGVLLALLSLANSLVMPAWRVLKTVATDHRFTQSRGWAAVSAAWCCSRCSCPCPRIPSPRAWCGCRSPRVSMPAPMASWPASTGAAAIPCARAKCSPAWRIPSSKAMCRPWLRGCRSWTCVTARPRPPAAVNCPSWPRNTSALPPNWKTDSNAWPASISWPGRAVCSPWKSATGSWAASCRAARWSAM
ncbi:MAG: M50 family metallopeptidase [Pseudomonadota bacterium]